MATIASRDTTPEVRLRKALYAAGVRGWRCHYRSAPGTPDLAWPGLRVAVFVDGAFWHGHPSKHRPGRSGEYWDDKIARNVERDRRVDDELLAMNWYVCRFWDFEIRRNLDLVVGRVAELVRTRRESSRLIGSGLVSVEDLRVIRDQGAFSQ
jgi:DNA mismatch endonuclease, patch repair protein